MKRNSKQPSYFTQRYDNLVIALEATAKEAGEIVEFVYGVDDEKVYRFRTANCEVVSGLLVAFTERDGQIFAHEDC